MAKAKNSAHSAAGSTSASPSHSYSAQRHLTEGLSGDYPSYSESEDCINGKKLLQGR